MDWHRLGYVNFLYLVLGFDKSTSQTTLLTRFINRTVLTAIEARQSWLSWCFKIGFPGISGSTLLG